MSAAPPTPALPTADDVRAAAARLAGEVHRTPVHTSRLLDAAADRQVFLKCENLQRAGAFKFRGATNAVLRLTPEQAAAGVCAHSSGNHAGALALAAARAGIPATLVIPRGAPSVKREAVASYGARIVECEPTLAAREEALGRVIAEGGATEIHPYDHPDVIAGAGTAAQELLDDVPDLDVVVAPVGGGGLLSGTALAAAGSAGVAVWGAEPAGADDAARSLRSGSLVPSIDPDTVADGLLTSLSERTFSLIARHVAGIATVTDRRTVAAMQFVWERTKLVIEPSAAVPIAAVLDGQIGEPGARIGIIVSGGNVELPFRR